MRQSRNRLSFFCRVCKSGIENPRRLRLRGFRLSSRSKLTSLNVSNTLTCVLQHLSIYISYLMYYWQPALTCVLQPELSKLIDEWINWQPALTCVLQRQKCTILQHAEFVNAGLFVHGYLLSLGLKKSRRVSTEYRSEKHFLLRILSAKIRVCIS